MRDSDRFWYENSDSFTQDEIHKITVTTFGNLVTLNTNGLTNFPTYVAMSAPVVDDLIHLNSGSGGDFPLDTSNYPNNEELFPGTYKLSWQLIDSTHINFLIQCKINTSWVGIGFEPGNPTSSYGTGMLKSDLYVGFVYGVGMILE